MRSVRSAQRHALLGRSSLLAATCALSLARVAYAQDDASIAARRGLIEQAEQARSAGDHARALDLARRAASLHASPSLRLFLAQEEEHTGALAAAWGQADQCVAAVRDDASVENRDVLLAACTDLANELRARVAWLTVRVPAPHPRDLVVRVHGAPLPPALWNVESVADPGRTTLEATAAGHAPFVTALDLVARQHASVVVQLRAVPSVVVHRAATPPRRDVTAPATVLGIGAVALLAAGGTLGGWAAEIARCPAARCADAATRSAVQGLGVSTYVLGGLGFVTGLAGAIWLGVRVSSPSVNVGASGQGAWLDVTTRF